MKFAWFDQALVSADSIYIASTDRGFLLGDGLFETMRLYQHKVLHLEAHLVRLTEGAALLHIPLPDIIQLRHAIQSVISHNNVAEGSLRLTLTRGPGPRGVLPPDTPHPTLMITQAPQGPVLGPCRVHFSRYRRDGTSPLNRVKHLNYLPQILSRLEAQQAGFDDALLLSSDGKYIAESSAASLVMLYEGQLHTPPLSNGALAGIARQTLLRARLCEETSLTPADLKQAQAAWLVNSLSVREIAMIHEHRLPCDTNWTHRLEATLLQGAP